MVSRKIPNPDETRESLASIYEEEGLKLVLLFGSIASGKHRMESDIDLAFLFDREVDIVGLTTRVIELLAADNVDVVELRKASPLLRFSIARNPIVLHESRPSMFSEFYSLSFRMFMDTEKIRSLRHRAIKEVHRGRERMTSVDRAIMERRLAGMTGSLRALEPVEAMTLKDYEADLYRRKATERLLQELIEGAIDIDIHIIVNMKGSPP